MSERFELTLSLNVLEHLGISLYSNVPSVLSETIANAWDADASVVSVDWNRGEDRIVITDNGVGMTVQEVNNRFLKVGYSRRDSQPGKTAKGRLPMGRKGIGKLSLFSVANVVQVETVKGTQKSAFVMKLNEIREQIQKNGGRGTYYPTTISTKTIDFPQGTRITLTDIKHRQTIRTPAALRKRVARRFMSLGAKHGFEIKINGDAVTPADRAYYDKLQYICTYGNQKDVLKLCTHQERHDSRDSKASSDLTVTGWLGTVKESKQLKDEDGDNLNKIAIFVRGKMAQEDILGDFSERGVYASYLVGEICVDGMDIYDGGKTTRDDDISTSSRQKLVEDDERYLALKDFLSNELKYIQSAWSELRADAGVKKALEIPAIQQWMDDLKPAVRAKAKKWLGKINRISMDNIEEQRQLIKHAVLGFEFYRLHQNLDQLDNISDESLPVALEIFQELDGLEANLYGQIVQQRMAVIHTLQTKVDENSLEKTIQKYLFDHLWLLDPSWERAEGTAVMERSVKRMFIDVDGGLTPEEKNGRLDIAYRKAAGSHVIIELKRPERVVTGPEIIKQAEKYLTGMEKLLEAQGVADEPVEIVFVLGKPPREWGSSGGKKRALEALKPYKSRVVFYDTLLSDAQKAYGDYVKQRKVVDRLAEIIQGIEDYSFEEEGKAGSKPAAELTLASLGL